MELNADRASNAITVFQGMPYLAGKFPKLLHDSFHGGLCDDARTKLRPNPRF